MTAYENRPRATRRRIIAWAKLRSLLNATILVALCYVLPLDQPLGTSAVVRVLIGLVVFAGSTGWQLRTIIGSPFPAVKAAEVLGLAFPFFLLILASMYFVMERTSAASFTQPMTRTDALYFTVTVFSTVGFGISHPNPRPPG